MTRHMIGALVIVLVIAACSSEATPTSASTTSTTPTTLPVGVELAITEVTFGAEGAVTLTNYGIDPIDLAGAWLGQGLSFVQFSPTVLAAGDSLVVGVGGSLDLDSGVATGGYVGIGDTLGSLEWTAGEAALFRHGDFDDPDALISYVQWGSATGRHAEIAGVAGLWDSPASVRTGSSVSGIVTDSVPAITAGDWFTR